MGVGAPPKVVRFPTFHPGRSTPVLINWGQHDSPAGCHVKALGPGVGSAARAGESAACGAGEGAAACGAEGRLARELRVGLAKLLRRS